MKKILLYALCLIFSAPLAAQYRLNFGLREKQKPSDLPASKTQIILPEKVVKAVPPAELKYAGSEEWIVEKGWQLFENNDLIASGQSIFSDPFDLQNSYNATVPGTILTTLVNQGIYPDPYFGINNLAIPDSLCRTDWWYRISFDMPVSVDGKKLWLLFNGINYRADVWLNGELIGRIAGAFKRGEFNVTGIARQKENTLAVHIFPPPNPGIPHEESPRSGPGPNGGQLCLDGPTFISSEGWDWIPGIRDRNMGIWQDVRLRMTGDVIIKNPRVITDLPLPDTNSAFVTIGLDLENTGDKTKTVTISGSTGDISFSQQATLNAGLRTSIVFSPEQYKQLQISNPKLWWPNGYGKQPLYHLTLTVRDENGMVSDSENVRFGIREFTYDLSVDLNEQQNQRIEFDPLKANGKTTFDNLKRRDVGEGVSIPALKPDYEKQSVKFLDHNNMAPYLVIKINGVPVFCRGGNWGMDDGMKRVTRDRLEPYFRLHKEAGFNMIRNWTGESTEELFYDLADEYGMLVWNDFWLSTEGYNLDVNDFGLFMENAEEVVLRFRNHPSIAIWCPRNEGYAPSDLEPQIAGLIASKDGTRHYQPNSRYLNLRPSGPWHYFKDAAEYFRINAHGFNTEQGTPSIPSAASMRKMMASEDVWPISDVWYYHDLHDGQKDYIDAINNLYGSSSDLETFCKKAQMINYDSHRAMFESWNSRMWNNTSGLLLWMTHPAWPSTVWQVYSWDYETFGSFFGSRIACEPVHVQMNLHDNQVVAVNTTQNDITDATVSTDYYDLQGKRLYHREVKKDIVANSLTSCFTADTIPGITGVYLARITLRRGNKIISLNDYWKKSPGTSDFTALNSIENAKPVIGKLVEKNCGKGYCLEFTIRNPGSKPIIAMKFNAKNAATDEIILPAYFSDGYFNLLPGEQRRITLSFEKKPEQNIQLIVDAYNLQ